MSGRDPRQDAALPLLHGAAAPLHAAARGAGGGAGGGVAARTHRAAQTFPAQTRAEGGGGHRTENVAASCGQTVDKRG